MQNQSSSLTEEGRQFFISQANQLRQSGRSVILETNTQHSRLTGRIYEVQNGGLVFQQSDTNDYVCVPWEKVDKLTGIGQQAGQQQQTNQPPQQSYAARSGGY